MRLMMIAAGAAALLAASAGAASAGTPQEVVAHGIVVTMEEMTIEVNFTPDGKLSTPDGAFTGTWRIDGDKLCSTTNLDPLERCQVYPAGKTSGDSFEVSAAQGVTMKVRIK